MTSPIAIVKPIRKYRKMSQNTSLLSRGATDRYDTYLKIDKKRYDPDTGRQIKKALSRGSRNRRIIKVVVIGPYEFSYHATRGWRKNKV
jgi:hypothetical protein